ncbi:hypothetical protein L7F22_042532 [Adiantum nelumboides]|nr:hypothetical protein [Adiantum nelumboides]
MHLKKALEVLRENRLYAKLSKCFFAKEEIVYLGRVISRKGIHIDPEKVRAIVEWPTPKCVRDVRSFMGLAQYERAHIMNFSKIASPLTDLTKKSKGFVWSEACQSAFELLKEKVAENCVLKILEMGKSFIVSCDASGEQLGCVLTQDGRVVVYESRKLRRHETHDLELLAVVQHSNVGVIYCLVLSLSYVQTIKA